MIKSTEMYLLFGAAAAILNPIRAFLVETHV